MEFQPTHTTREIEEYDVQLSDVTVLELVIMPDISGGAARASLKSLIRNYRGYVTNAASV
ncbi:MAG: hypothetical protein LAP86_20730 [Acidobacteriia bacterium]|nr:hypothetical protein [Terriglobia bacterium]